MSDWMRPDDPANPAGPAAGSGASSPTPPPVAVPPAAGFTASPSSPSFPSTSGSEPVTPGPEVAVARRRRRRWPWVVLAVVLALLLGAGGSFFVTRPTRNRLQDERDALQSQLDQANASVDQANTEASTARAARDSCQRLATDVQHLLDVLDKLDALFSDPANQNVAPGSAQEQALIGQEDALVSSLTFERGSVSSDADACKAPAAGGV